jgi:hypothetical protein
MAVRESDRQAWRARIGEAQAAHARSCASGSTSQETNRQGEAAREGQRGRETLHGVDQAQA